jgi:hypothetical protein
LVASQRGVFDLGSVAELNGDRVSEDIPQGPFTIARVVQILIRPTYEHADEIAVCRLGQVKDPRDLALSCTLRSDGNGLLMPKQVVQDELDRRLAGGPRRQLGATVLNLVDRRGCPARRVERRSDFDSI